MDTLAAYTGADIFLLSPKTVDADSAVVSSYGCENGLESRFRVAIYGDMESAEHAKTRLLIMIDQIVRLTVHFLNSVVSDGASLPPEMEVYVLSICH